MVFQQLLGVCTPRSATLLGIALKDVVPQLLPKLALRLKRALLLALGAVAKEQQPSLLLDDGLRPVLVLVCCVAGTPVV